MVLGVPILKHFRVVLLLCFLCDGQGTVSRAILHGDSSCEAIIPV